MNLIVILRQLGNFVNPFAMNARKLFLMDTDISGDLKVFRRKLRMTQDEVARRIGATRGQYANWEAGLANPPHEYILKLKQLGFLVPHDSSFVSESHSLYGVRASNRQLQILIDILFDTSIAEPIRVNAKAELETALGIQKQDF